MDYKTSVRINREREIDELARYMDRRKAESVYRRLIRAGMLHDRLAEEDQDEREWNSRAHKRRENRLEGMSMRLEHDLAQHGLELLWPGIYPLIVNGKGQNVAEGYYF